MKMAGSLFKNRTRDFMKHTWAAEAMEKPSLLMHTRVHAHQTIILTKQRRHDCQRSLRPAGVGPSIINWWRSLWLAASDRLAFLLQLGPQTGPQMGASVGVVPLLHRPLEVLSGIQIRNHSKPDCGQKEIHIPAKSLSMQIGYRDLESRPDS